MERPRQPRSRRTSLTRDRPSLSLSEDGDAFYRPAPILRNASQHSLPPSHSRTGSANNSPRLTPLLPGMSGMLPQKIDAPYTGPAESQPTILGMPLKYVSLVTLAAQNAALSIVMHYSRVYTPPELSYSPASAVLLNEVLKGSISFAIALARVKTVADVPWHRMSLFDCLSNLPFPGTRPFMQLCSEIFSRDCWKLSIPAILYVIQNSLQFVAVSNLPVAAFQVTYQMKILTTAAFSVALLKKKLTSAKWLSLLFLSIGVGIVQLSMLGGSSHDNSTTAAVGSAHDASPRHAQDMNQLKGFGAVAAACFTSGLAGVYFEMVLKGSKADLWVRNVQLSLFSLVPALLPVLYSGGPRPAEIAFISHFFRNFGGWAWATVLVQVLGGLITAVVIKYSDNILKGFATSLSIILSALASVALFDFPLTPTFIVGSSTVLAGTAMYNQPDRAATKDDAIEISVTSPNGEYDGVIIGEPLTNKSKRLSGSHAIASALGFGLNEKTGLAGANGDYFNETWDTQRYLESPYGSPYGTPYHSRPASRPGSRPATPPPRSPPNGSS